ncbi:probable protein phosphatase 2C 27 isoform X2 [Magnolia sinica]|uniref:probable protein phosphatase 2C 27 isoform X2 n=1 Tax=Magnolia sinica TaxID=86752 RepID=UPI00265B51BA|nr:probable protein phosphatase 2C 27 isoform X2 [Magnolia sinica]
MAAGTDLSHPFTVLDGRFCNDNRPPIGDENSEALESLKQMNTGKPPRHLSVIRHCISSAQLVAEDELNIGPKSPANEKSVFLPIFHSGSCSDKGPKQYMEDEHLCIDNLLEHLGEVANFPPLGAFYGVSNINTADASSDLSLVVNLPYHSSSSSTIKSWYG